MFPRDNIYRSLSNIALSEFPDIIETTQFIEGKLRLFIIDGSYIDIWLSEKKPGTYAYHWERGDIDGTIYRQNNLPDKKARKLKTFPKHFHRKTEEGIEESTISDIPEEALKYFLNFVRGIIKK